MHTYRVWGDYAYDIVTTKIYSYIFSIFIPPIFVKYTSMLWYKASWPTTCANFICHIAFLFLYNK